MARARRRGMRAIRTGGSRLAGFSRRLREVAGGASCVGKPQRWTGYKSETSRREAGAALLARLRRLDARGISYHLIGHSHGGSVIWHALVGSARSGRPLSGLKSWVTVGTPFLRFAPDATAWWKYIGLTMSCAALAWASGPLIEVFNEQSSILRVLPEQGTMPLLYALFTLMLFAVLALQTMSFIVQAAGHVLGLLGRAGRTLTERRAAGWYGGSWLALWHECDEAIAGLRASLVDPYPLWPRWAAAGSPRLKRVALAFHDFGFARAIDQFVWAVGVGRLQGVDIADRAHGPGGALSRRSKSGMERAAVAGRRRPDRDGRCEGGGHRGCLPHEARACWRPRRCRAGVLQLRRAGELAGAHPIRATSRRRKLSN